MAVFLSYSRRDEDVVTVLARGFHAAHREVWFDHDLDGGEVWWDTILRNIRACSVFVLAVSDDSLASRACTAELEYAEQLGRPILPVEVGRVTAVRSYVLADLQSVYFDPDDAATGFSVLAAADHAAERAGPLPDPLPPEPPTPFAYLQAVRRSIERGGLSHSQQLTAVDQLRRALSDETEVSVRDEIVAILASMQDKPWLSRGAAFEVRAVLIAHRTIEAEVAGDPTPGPAEPEEPTTGRGAFTGGGLDPSTAFLERIDSVHRQMQAGKFWREAASSAPSPPAETGQGPTGPVRFAGVTGTAAGSEPSTGDGFRWERTAAEPERTGPDTAPLPAVVPVPARWPLSVVALLAWAVAQSVVALRLGVIALVLLAPGAVAVAAAVSSHRVSRLVAAGHPDRAVRTSRTARTCGAVALVGLAVAVVAVLGTVPTAA